MNAPDAQAHGLDGQAALVAPVQILHLEDDANDAELVRSALELAAVTCGITRVETRDEFSAALRRGGFDVILADFRLPTFDGVSALRMAQELGADIPFIFVSGTMGEDAAIEGLTQGATDYVLKQKLSRLAPAVSRALHDAENRRARRQAEAALRESEARFRSIFESAVVGVVVRDLEGRLLQANPAYERLVGCTAEELHGTDVSAVVHPEDEPHYRQILAELAAGRRDTFVFEKRLLRKDGTVMWGRLSGAAVRGPAGRPHFVVAMVEDITARKQAEQEREALIELLHLLNTSADTHALLRSTTAFLSRVTACEAVGVRLCEGEDYPYFETHGFPAEFVEKERRLCAVDARGELVRDSAGHPVLECMCGNILCGRFDPSRPFFTAHGSFWTNGTSELLASTTAAERQSRTRNRCNGEGYESVALLPLRQGGTTFGLLQCNDRQRGRFTPEKIAMLERFADHLAIGLAQRRAEAALRESEECYRTVADFTHDWEYWLGPDGALRYCSPACERITGYRAEEFACAPDLLTDIIHPDDRPRVVSHHHEAPDTAAELQELEYRIRTRSGEERWIAHACQFVRGRDGAHLGRRASNRDITARRRAEERVAQQLQELQRWYQVTLNREGRVAELKREVNQLLARLGESPRYAEQEADACGRVSGARGSQRGEERR